MITIWARLGKGWGGRGSGGRRGWGGRGWGGRGSGGRADSVIALDVLEQAAEVVGRESGRGALEPFHRPRPEVEVERARGVLNGAPQGPPVHARQAEQPGPGDPVAQRPPVVDPDQLRQRVHREVALGPDVAELEAGVVVAGVLVVDQPDPVPVIDEV